MTAFDIASALRTRVDSDYALWALAARGARCFQWLDSSHEVELDALDRPRAFRAQMTQEFELRRQLTELRSRVRQLEAECSLASSLREELSASRARVRFLQDAYRLGLLEWSSDAQELRIDPETARRLGLAPLDEDARLDFESLLHEGDRARWRAVLESVRGAAESGRESLELRALAPDGQLRVLEAHLRKLTIDGDAKILQCACRDVTEQIRMESDLREKAERLREAEELAHVGNWTWDVRSGEVQWSDEVYRIFGLDPDDFTPQIDSILALSPWPEDHKRDKELIERAVANRERGDYEQRFLLPDGEIGYYFSTFQGIYEGDELVAMRGTVQDITERKRAELEVKRNEENLRVTLDSIGDAVIATDKAGRVTRMNPIAERLTDWTLEEARGRPLTEVFEIVHAHTRLVAENPVEKVLETDRVVGLANHTVLISRHGAEYQIADSGAPIRSAPGETVGVVLVFRDVTEEYALQERLRQSEKMEAIGQLAGGVAHDFNNMLSGILGSAELLQPHLEPNAEARELHAILLQSAEQAASLTEQLLSFSRHEPWGSDVLDVHAVLERALAILRRTHGRHIRITTALEASPSTVEGDLGKLQNAFLNIGINAAQAMPQGGELSITTRNAELSVSDCEASPFDVRPGPHIATRVRDNGHGIPADILDRVFEPFFTTKVAGEGTGLGMAAVYGSVKNSGGAIAVESQVGVGTEFTILLPVVEHSGAVLGAPPLAEAHDERGEGLVLVVDDEAIARATAEIMLRHLGYDVLVAESGAQALHILERRSEDVDLVMLDMIMPEMSGRACFAAMRERHPSLRVLLCSGFADERDVEAMLAQGLAGFVRKPYRSADLSAAVRAAIRGAAS